MRYICAALAIVISSAATAAAQVAPLPTVRSINSLAQLMPPQAGSRVSVDAVLARMMTFDRDRDGKVTTSELSERMEGLVARGDRTGDGALDESEIRFLATEQQFVARLPQGGGYGFADAAGLSSRNHIENSIDDLRLAPSTSQEAKRIAMAFVDDFEAASVTNLRQALAPVVTAQQLTQLEASLTRFHGVTTVVTTTVRVRQPLQSEEMRAVAAAADAFRSERQLDEARLSELATRLSDLLTVEESDNLRAALARRPLVKGPGSSLARVLPTVRDVQFTAQPTAP